MVLAPVNPGGSVTASTQNQIIAAVNQIALAGIIPTVTAPTSGAASVSTDGSVTFTNASNVSLNGCFTGAFNNYRIVFNVLNRSNSTTINFRLRQAGNDLTTATYGWVKQQISGTSPTNPQTATAATAVGLDSGFGVGQTSDGFFDVYGPALGTYTAMNGSTFSWASSAPYLFLTGMQNSTTSASDGFSMYPVSGTFTGMVRVYGYNNLT